MLTDSSQRDSPNHKPKQHVKHAMRRTPIYQRKEQKISYTKQPHLYENGKSLASSIRLGSSFAH
jgi:hypothetical protein